MGLRNNKNKNDQQSPTVEKRKTVLIVGVSSFVGSNLAEFLHKDFRVVGTYYRRPVHIPGVLALPCNVVNKEEVQLVLYAFKPDIVIYCAGLTSLTDCDQYPQLSDALNSGGLYNFAELAPRYGARIVYLSSQYLFAGQNRNYNEMDNPDVITMYGKSQASAEFYLQKSSLNYLILRCSKLYGRGVNPIKYNFFEVIQKNLKNSTAGIYDDYVKIGFIDVYYLAMVLKICIDKDISNRLLQLSSQDILSHYEFAKLYCQVFQESDALINKGKWQFPILKNAPVEKIEEVMKFKLDVLNIEGFLRIKLPTVQESLEFTRKRLGGHSVGVKKDKQGEGVSFI